ncbi:MAG: hypothetical protein HC908_17665 [Calothrix sp. SM1_7_51]|nr:hypothetical protein [Calothrix sp. SM1_7_51]
MSSVVNLYSTSKLKIICLCLNILIGSLFTLAQSKLAYSSTELPDKVVFHKNFDPPGEPEPKTTSGAGSRDIQRCGQDEEPIKAF